MKALVVVADHLEGLARSAGVLITGDLRGVIATAGAAQASVIDSQLPPGQDLVALDSWSQVSDRAIDAIVRRSTQQITSRTRPLSREAATAVRRELIRGVAAGSNPKATARRIIARTEGRFNGGLNRALNIARTETLDAHRAGAALGMSQHADVLRGWEWLAAMDERTCPSCWAQHGSMHTARRTRPERSPAGPLRQERPHEVVGGPGVRHHRAAIGHTRCADRVRRASRPTRRRPSWARSQVRGVRPLASSPCRLVGAEDEPRVA
jgi:hypothetical protein